MKKPDKISSEQKDLMVRLGKRIKQLRIDQKKSYEVTAKEMGVPRNTYYNIEAGRLNFQFSSLCQILLYYKHQQNITMAEIFKDL